MVEPVLESVIQDRLSDVSALHLARLLLEASTLKVIIFYMSAAGNR